MPIRAPEPRVTLYVRIKKSNKKFIDQEAKRLGFKSVAQFLDAKIDSWKNSAKRSKKKGVKLC